MTIEPREDDGNLARHAIRELDLCGQTGSDPEFALSLVNAVRGFANYGHSGGSHSVAVEMLSMLLHFETLSPIGPDDAWNEVGENVWQSQRSSALFSSDGGKTYYDVNDPEREIFTVAVSA